jgi:hypothetical protein
MVAVAGMGSGAPALPNGAGQHDVGRFARPAQGRRVVAVAVDAAELLRPGADLARLVERFPRIDLLVAAEDARGERCDDGEVDERPFVGAPGDESPAEPSADGPADGARDRVDGLDIPGLHLHRLGLPVPLDPTAAPDLVAALSELVGFDPEPGVYVLAPAPTDPARSLLNGAARRIAQVYGIPLLRYRCLELSFVGADAS